MYLLDTCKPNYKIDLKGSIHHRCYGRNSLNGSRGKETGMEHKKTYYSCKSSGHRSFGCCCPFSFSFFTVMLESPSILIIPL